MSAAEVNVTVLREKMHRGLPLTADESAFLAQVLDGSQVDPRMARPSIPACALPPAGWRCTRAPGHEGPCAALPVEPLVPVQVGGAKVEGFDLSLAAAQEYDPQSFINGAKWQAARASLAPVSAQQGVPRVPTEGMLNAARDWSVKKYAQGIGNDAAIGCWEAMYDAAAKAPAAQADALALLKRAHRVLSCASIVMIGDGEKTWEDIGKFLASPASTPEAAPADKLAMQVLRDRVTFLEGELTLAKGVIKGQAAHAQQPSALGRIRDDDAHRIAERVVKYGATTHSGIFSIISTTTLSAATTAGAAETSEDARDAALTAARAWIVKNRPALTLSRQSTIDEYMRLLDTIDAAMRATF